MTSHELLIDKRIVHRNIEQGKLERAEYQRLLSALPDLSDKVWRRPAASAADTSSLHASAPAVARAPEPAPEQAPELDSVPPSAPHAEPAPLLETAVQTQPTALPV